MTSILKIMINNEVGTISPIKEENINSDRIADDDLVFDEFFCPIYQYLL
jgi:hypothetical protein